MWWTDMRSLIGKWKKKHAAFSHIKWENAAHFCMNLLLSLKPLDRIRSFSYWILDQWRESSAKRLILRQHHKKYHLQFSLSHCRHMVGGSLVIWEQHWMFGPPVKCCVWRKRTCSGSWNTEMAALCCVVAHLQGQGRWSSVWKLGGAVRGW